MKVLRHRINHAVVIGGSLAGLLSARVLSERFARVTIIERDVYPRSVAPRRGVPQAHHVHALLPRGRQILDELFTGFTDEMIAEGAVLFDMASDAAWLTPKGWGVRFASDLRGLSFTRSLLDYVVRRRIARLENITVIEGTSVTRLLPNEDNSRVKGLKIRPRNLFEDEREEAAHSINKDASTTDKTSTIEVDETLYADLIVDASGRASRAPKWLEALGYEVPRETCINAHRGYASRFYRIPANTAKTRDWCAAFLQAAPPAHNRFGIMFPVEGNRWLLTLGDKRELLPHDEANFLNFTRSLRSDIIYKAIKRAEPLSPIIHSHTTENRLRHYDQLARLPANFIVTGDAVCAFNPVYGQGMTTAALGALTLRESLERAARVPSNDTFDRGFSRRFQRRLARNNSFPWSIATSEDYRYPYTTGGAASFLTRVRHRYLDYALDLTTRSAHARRLLLRVFGMVSSPLTLFQPYIALRVAINAIKDLLINKSRLPSHSRTATPRVENA